MLPTKAVFLSTAYTLLSASVSVSGTKASAQLLEQTQGQIDEFDTCAVRHRVDSADSNKIAHTLLYASRVCADDQGLS